MADAIRDMQKRPPTAPKGPSQKRLKIPVWPFLVVAVAFGGWLAWDQLGSAVSGTAVDESMFQVYRVKRGPLVVTVTEDGNVQSASNVELKCQVEGGSQILWIIPEGTQVTKGTELVRLDSALIEEQITQQKIAYEMARSLYIEQEEAHAVADIAVKEYIQGTYLQELQTADANIVIARENLKSAQNILEHSEKMFRKGYINQLQLETSRFAVQRSQLDLDTFLTARKVLTEFTKAKREKELASARDSTLAAMLAQKAATDLEKSKLDRLTEQLKRCTIVAPQDGMVIYANDRNRWGSETNIIEEGTNVREYQTLIKLPDLQQMQAKVLVHETKVEMIHPGMLASIRIRDRDMRGTVVSVSSQPEPTSFFSAQVKEYSTLVNIDDAAEGSLKPGMTAEVEILVHKLADVLTVPLLGVVESDGKYYCFVRTQKPGQWYEKREVVTGISNETFMEIKDGLQEDELIILNPRATIEEARRTNMARSKDPGGKSDFARNQPATETVSPGKEGKSTEAPGDTPTKTLKAKKNPDFTTLDKNGDGKLTEDELPDSMKQFFSRIDANKDGSIDRKELLDARKAAQKRQQPPGEQARAPGPPGPPSD